MKILKGPDPWTKVLTCAYQGCETKVEIEASDVLYGFLDHDYTELGDPSFYVECPTCGETIVIEELPKIVKNLAKQKFAKKTM